MHYTQLTEKKKAQIDILLQQGLSNGYIGAGIGGGVTGTLFLAHPVLGAGLGASVSTAVNGLLDAISGRNVNMKELGEATVRDGIEGACFEKFLPDAKIKGITSGRNSFNAGFKSGTTKLTNGTASKMSAKVIAKGTIASTVKDFFSNVIRGLEDFSGSTEGETCETYCIE